MRNKPLWLCFSALGVFYLMFFPYCYCLRNDGCDFLYCFNGTWGGKVIQILAEGSFSLKVERLVWMMSHLSTQKKWDVHQLMTNYCAVCEALAWKAAMPWQKYHANWRQLLSVTGSSHLRASRSFVTWVHEVHQVTHLLSSCRPFTRRKSIVSHCPPTKGASSRPTPGKRARIF